MNCNWMSEIVKGAGRKREIEKNITICIFVAANILHYTETEYTHTHKNKCMRALPRKHVCWVCGKLHCTIH